MEYSLNTILRLAQLATELCWHMLKGEPDCVQTVISCMVAKGVAKGAFDLQFYR